MAARRVARERDHGAHPLAPARGRAHLVGQTGAVVVFQWLRGTDPYAICHYLPRRTGGVAHHGSYIRKLESWCCITGHARSSRGEAARFARATQGRRDLTTAPRLVDVRPLPPVDAPRSFCGISRRVTLHHGHAHAHLVDVRPPPVDAGVVPPELGQPRVARWTAYERMTVALSGQGSCATRHHTTSSRPHLAPRREVNMRQSL